MVHNASPELLDMVLYFNASSRVGRDGLVWVGWNADQWGEIMAGHTQQDWLNFVGNDASSDGSTSAGTDIAMPSLVLEVRPRTRSCYDDYIPGEESMGMQLQMTRDRLRRCRSLEARKKPLWQ